MRNYIFDGIDDSDFGLKHSFGRLVSLRTGLIQHVEFLEQDIGVAPLVACAASLGNLTHVHPRIVSPEGGDVSAERLGGAGASPYAELAWTKTVVESAERYATMVHRPEEWRLATGHELGADAIDLDAIPRLAQREVDDPKCPLRLPDATKPIRWVGGYSLVDKRERYVPAIMTHLYVTPLESERFWIPISTGVAAHTSLIAAVVGAIYEIVERDAIALTWLLQRRLPLIDPRSVGLPKGTESFLAGGGINQTFLDATTDLAIPTVIAIQESPRHATCKVFMTASTNRTFERACCKSFDEFAPSRTAMRGDREIPIDFDDYRTLLHGADYYASGHGREHLAFLLDEAASPRAARPTTNAPAVDDPAQELRWLVARLAALRMDAVAVDLTTDELASVGLHAVRVVIPQLMPISFMHRARFLGSERLRAFASVHGFSSDMESLNHAPLPFA